MSSHYVLASSSDAPPPRVWTAVSFAVSSLLTISVVLALVLASWTLW